MNHTDEFHYCTLPRKIARKRGILRYMTGRPCKRGGVAARRCPDGACTCIKCSRSQAERSLDWYKNNTEYANKRHKRWLSENREDQIKKMKEYREKNSEYFSRYFSENIHRYLEHSSVRRGRIKKRSIPEHQDEIKRIYNECRAISENTGIPHEVDHIVPLQGKNVSGLHVPWNLQIITAEENRSKGNRLSVVQ